MADKKNFLPSKIKVLKPMIVAAIILIIAWILEKGYLNSNSIC